MALSSVSILQQNCLDGSDILFDSLLFTIIQTLSVVENTVQIKVMHTRHVSS